jgi:hypothetical protein
MLDRLRLDTLVGTYDQQDGVDSRGARNHRANEALMARHVDQVDLTLGQG